MNQQRISGKVEERDYEVSLGNHKNEPIVVKVEKKLWGDWQVISANFEYKKKDAYTLVFNLPVAANDTTLAKYKVRFTNQ